MKLLLDTNVLIDYYLSRPGFAPDARRLFALAALGEVELWASAKSFTDVFFVGSRAVDPTLLQEVIARSLDVLNVCSIDGGDVRACLEQKWPDFEDCLVARAAGKVKADAIVTRDLGGFARSAVPARTPAEVVGLLGPSHPGLQDIRV
jgi:predicted nucleic acid-binding protein